MNAEQTAKSDSTSKASEMDQLFEPLNEMANQANNNAAQAQSDTQSVTAAITSMTNAAAQALAKARSAKSNQAYEEEKLKALTDDVVSLGQNAVQNMKMQKQITLTSDSAVFKSLHQNLLSTADALAAEFDGALEKSQMKSETRSLSFMGKIDRFLGMEKKWSDTTSDYNKEAKSSIKDLKKKMKKSKKKFDKNVKKTSKLLAKVAKKILKAFLPKKFDKHLKKTEKQVLKLQEKALKKLQKENKKQTKGMKKQYANFVKQVEKTKETILKDADELKKTSKAESAKQKEEYKQLGKDIKSVAKGIKQSARSVKKQARSMGQNIKAVQRESMAEIRTLEKTLGKAANERVPVAQAEIDSMVANTEATIGKSSTELANTLSGEAESLDQRVQEDIMQVNEPMAEVEALVQKIKSMADSFAATAAQRGASVGTEASRAAKELKEASDTVEQGKNELDFELRNLRSKLGLGENDYNRASQTVLNALASKLKARIEKIEQPVQAQLSTTIREVGKALQDADVVQRGKLDGLKSNLREIQLILRRNNNEDKFNEVMSMLQATDLKLESLTTDLENLKQSRITTQHEVESNVDLEIQKILNNVNSKIAADEATVREKLRKRQSDWTTTLNKYSGRVQTLKGETATFDEQAKDYQRELGDKLKTQEELLAAAQQAMDTSATELNSGVDEIQGSELSRLQTVGSRENIAAENAVKTFLSEQKALTMEKTGEQKEKSIAAISAMADSESARLTSKANEFRDSFNGAVDSIMSETSALKTKAENTVAKAEAFLQKATSDYNSLTQNAKSVSEDSGGLGEQLAEQVKADKEKADEAKKKAEGGFAEAMDGDLAAVLKRLSRASEAENEKFKGMAKAMMGAGAGLQEGLAAMRQAELEADSAVGQESKLVNAEVSGAEDQSRYAESEATSKLNEIENAANSQEQAASTNMQADEARNAQTNALNARFISEMSNNVKNGADASQQQRDQQITVIQGDIEALKAENTAAFAGVQSSLENAQATADRDEADILQAEGDLWFLANETMGHLGEFMNVSGTQIETFQARLKDEKDSLAKSMGYLNKYEAYTEWQALNLLEVEIELVSAGLNHAGNMFEKMEKKENEFERRVSTTMNSDAFQTLKQIYDANMFVQKATHEDDEIVGDLETHEKKALPWMQEVLVALNEAHEEMVASEQAGGQMSQNMAGQSAAHTSAALSALASDVSSQTNDTSAATLSADVDQTVNMMNAEAKTAAENDNATLAGIQSQYEQNMNSVNAQVLRVGNELSAIESVTAKAANSMGSIQRMVNSFVKTQKRMESTAAEATKQRMADALSSFSNSSFIETHAETPVNDGRTQTGKSAVIKVNSGLPATPRLRSLVAQHDYLEKLHQGLSVRHKELGTEVKKIAEINRKKIAEINPDRTGFRAK